MKQSTWAILCVLAATLPIGCASRTWNDPNPSQAKGFFDASLEAYRPRGCAPLSAAQRQTVLAALKRKNAWAQPDETLRIARRDMVLDVPESHRPLYDSLDDLDILSILSYTGPYFGANAFLRNGPAAVEDPGEMKLIAHALHIAVSKMPLMKAEVRRREGSSEKRMANYQSLAAAKGTYREQGFLSTSFNFFFFETENQFVGKTDRIVIRDAVGFDVSHLSVNRTEKELLLMPGAILRVDSIRAPAIALLDKNARDIPVIEMTHIKPTRKSNSWLPGAEPEPFPCFETLDFVD